MFQVSGGLATLGPRALEIIRLVERRIAGWAKEIGAEEYSYPSLLRVEDLSQIDYFQNFPHLGSFAAKIRPDRIEREYASRTEQRTTVPAADLADPGYVLPSAACYGAYFALKGATLKRSTYVSTLVRCFRNEAEYVALRRLWSFQMRELVCVGTAEAVQDHLRSFRARIEVFTKRAGLPLAVSVATDPFFDKSSSRAVMQQIFPVKEEFVYGGDLAIASVNFHRNFFGERCDIRGPDGSPAFTGCVAFGLERWVSALSAHFDGRSDRIASALESA